MTRVKEVLLGAAVVALSVGLAGAAGAGGQLNKCWGDITQQQAKLPTPDGTKGGARGQHARSTTAADKNGGFANSGNDFGIFFNELNADGNHGRAGVGNASSGPPHANLPGDPQLSQGEILGNGGNGQHAINNGTDTVNGLAFSNTLNPTTGTFTTNVPGGTAEVVELTCDFVDAP